MNESYLHNNRGVGVVGMHRYHHHHRDSSGSNSRYWRYYRVIWVFICRLGLPLLLLGHMWMDVNWQAILCNNNNSRNNSSSNNHINSNINNDSQTSSPAVINRFTQSSSSSSSSFSSRDTDKNTASCHLLNSQSQSLQLQGLQVLVYTMLLGQVKS